MNVMYFMFGFVVSTLIWAIVLMRMCEKDLADSAKMRDLLNDYFKSAKELDEDRVRVMEDTLSVCKRIENDNSAFKGATVELLTEWSRMLGNG